MTPYKLGNVSRKTAMKYASIMKKEHSCKATISRKKFSIGYLKELHEKYFIQGFYEYRYCCYGEDRNCWVDVECLDAGWVWLMHRPSEMPDVIFNMAKGFKSKEKSLLYNRKIFIVECDKEIDVIIPMRDVKRVDYIITFAKDKNTTIDIF